MKKKIILLITASVFRLDYQGIPVDKNEKYIVVVDEEASREEALFKYLGEDGAVEINSIKLLMIQNAIIKKMGNCDIYKVVLEHENLLESGKKKISRQNYYIQTDGDISKSLKIVEDELFGTISDYRIVSAALTNIIDIIKES
ncbi:MAG: DUF4494 family protein [Tannerella sp.]|jgi:hypothetical protein|nr:DUF4494 family protein [Tannerella sp.]